ncbi:FMN-binding negative transcriptional regulator [Pseudooceanicola sp.]|uniref:FMN-binding negative transcriptional regulator n=1 Tax=Pseudooceanicola sp. TaxID=1914328 RepID=UPI0035127F8F
MYTPPAYSETDTALLHRLMQEWSFATLVSSEMGAPLATHLPFLVDPGGSQGLGRLVTHLARNNPHWEALEDREVLVIFQGPHAFVSVDWYDNHLTYPTWNYGAIHARGRVKLERDPEALRALLRRFIGQFQPAETKWSFDEMPEEMTAPRLRAIVGLELDITRLDGKLKFNQDKSDTDRAGVRAALSNRAEGAETACLMSRLDRMKESAK